MPTRLKNLSPLLVLFCLLAAFSASASQIVRGHVPRAVAQLAPAGRLAETNELKLAIGLPLRHAVDLTNFLGQVYQPGGPQFHQFLTPDEFTARFGASEGDYASVSNFARLHNLSVTDVHSNRMVLDVAGAVSNIESAFHIHLRTYRHPVENRLFYAPDAEPSLDLATPIAHISGLDNFTRPKPMNLRPRTESAAKPLSGSAPGGGYAGKDFRAAYVPNVSLTGTGQLVGLLEFDGFFPSDVAAYNTLTGLSNIPLKTVLLDGFNGIPGGNNTEVSLDIDMATSMAPGLSGIVIYEGEQTDDILNRMATDNLAKQLSASWTYTTDPVSEQIFLEFAAQGQSFFNAAGDSDAYTGSPPQPTDDPNITSVGGTTLTTSGPGGAWVSETVWNWGNDFGSGGGISATWSIPSWQQGVNMSSNGGSAVWRNLPDVALTADNVWLIYDDGSDGIFGGTSCAAPLWAAFTALVNEQALANGKPLQGFINPAIYALGGSTNYATTFHDITTGNNTSSTSPNEFYAVTGFDLCTGWGTPNGSNLINQLAPLDALQILPASGFSTSGGMGGPFSTNSEIFLLTNTSAQSLSVELTTTASWLTISGAVLFLPARGSAPITISLNSVASNQVPGVYTARAWFTNASDNTAQSRTFTLNILTPPSITTLPTNVTVLGGATVHFNVAAVGGLPLAYQWQQNGANLTDGGNVSGSSTPNLTITNVSLSQAGLYTVVVSNAAAAVTNSPPAILTVVSSQPVLTSQPASQFALSGQPVQFSASALGNGPLAFQWKFNSTNLTDGGAISGSATSTLTIIPALGANAGSYSVTVTNQLGSASSSNAVLTVYALAATQLVQNGGFETGDFTDWNLSGETAFDSVSSDSMFAWAGLYGAEMGAIGTLGYISQTVPTIPGSNYLLSFWLDSPDGETPNECSVAWNGYTVWDQTNLPALGWTNVQLALSATANYTTIQLGFRNDNSSFGLDNVSVELLGNPNGAPVITNQPAAQVVTVAGGTALFTVGATGQQPLFYQWLSNQIPIINATNAALTLSNVNVGETASYSLTVTNALGSATSATAFLSVLNGNMELITFDDLDGSDSLIPNCYGGLTWSNFACVNPPEFLPAASGYTAGTISSPNVAFNNSGGTASITNSTPFALLSAWFTAAWNNNLRLQVKAYATNGAVYSAGYTLSATQPALLTFNYVGITNVQFTSSGGTQDTNYDELGFEFVLDNAAVVLSPVIAPTNISCASAIVITTDPYTNFQSTAGVVYSGGPLPPCVNNFSNAVWYAFTPTASGQLFVNTTNSAFDAIVAVYTGQCGNLTNISCGGGSFFVTGGTTYYLQIGAAGDVFGNLSLETSFTSATSGPPLILSQPAGASVPFGSNATFFVNAEGARPLIYIWERNGSPIAGANVASYTLTNVQNGDNGALFSCVISNTSGVVTSTAAGLTVTAPGQLVQNGGFETGDFTGWTLTGNTSDVIVANTYAHSGDYGAGLGSVGSLGYLSQTLATTPGQEYLLSFWLYSFGGTPSDFFVQWGGTVLYQITNAPVSGWTNFIFDVPAQTSATVLQFGERDDPNYLALDDVSVLSLSPAMQGGALNNMNLSLSWTSQLGFSYQVQYSTNLAQTNWTSVGGPIIATNYLTTATEPVNHTNVIFYRVVLTP